MHATAHSTQKGHEKVSVPCLKMNGLMWMWLLLKGGSINYHRKVFFYVSLFTFCHLAVSFWFNLLVRSVV